MYGDHTPRRDTTLVRSPIVRRFPTGAPLAIGTVLVTGIAILDWATGTTISVGLLHALAITTVTWFGSRRNGLLVSGLAGAETLAAAVWAGGALTVPVLLNAATRLGVLVVVTVLVASLRDSLVEQRRLATVDPLTGSLNRRAFGLVAERERLRAGRNGGAITVAYFDLDEFKTINDEHGHATGDRLLRVFAASVRAGIRSTDIFSRMGGDEFVLLLPDTDARDSVVIVDRVRRILADLCETEGTAMTTSIGIATYRFPPSSIDVMVAGADELMYRAKARGGDSVVGSVIVGPWTRWSDHVAEVDRQLEHLDDVVVVPRF
jgi:diguanylate cyclase (GGDEF)-like protein